jgi:cytochrome bd-type quinol oxidase subunit 2
LEFRLQAVSSAFHTGPRKRGTPNGGSVKSRAQYPNLVTPDVTVIKDGALEVTLRLLVWALGIGAIVLLPSLGFLFYIFKGEGATDEA